MQKCIRFRADNVKLLDGTIIKTDIFLLVVSLTLINHEGTLSLIYRDMCLVLNLLQKD